MELPDLITSDSLLSTTIQMSSCTRKLTRHELITVYVIIVPGGVGHDSQSMPEEIFDCTHYCLIVGL